jgi:hypothetical protein
MDHELFDGGELRDVDPLDPAAMRALLPNMDMSAPEMLAINVGRPSDEEFFRTHPDDAFTMLNNVVEHGRRTYVVAPSMIHECGAKVRTAVLVTYFGEYSGVGIWPIRRPRGSESNFGSWWATSALELVARARGLWVRLESNQAASRYDCIVAHDDRGEPRWPDVSFADLLKLAFGGGGVIDNRDHPVLKALRGER